MRGKMWTNWQRRRLLLVVSETADIIEVVAPVLFDLYPCLHIDLCTHETLNVLAGVGTDALEHCAVLADDDALVAGFLTVDGYIQINDTIVTLGETGNLDRSTVESLYPDYAEVFRARSQQQPAFRAGRWSCRQGRAGDLRRRSG